MKSAIIGAGTYGQVYFYYLKRAGIEVVAFIDDNREILGKEILGVPVLCTTAELSVLQKKYGIEAVYCPIGNNDVRVRILEQAKAYGLKTPCFIDKSAEIADGVTIGEGVYILVRATVMPFVKLEDYVMLSMSCNIAHHSVLKKGTFISTGVNFGASIEAEEKSYVGIGATIMTGLHRLGKSCLIGAGSVVVRDVPDNAVMAGVPAKVLKIKTN